MIRFLYIIAATCITTVAAASPITTYISFQNNSVQKSISGVLYIDEIDQAYTITSLEQLKIELPQLGDYNFRFTAPGIESFNLNTTITETENEVVIVLEKTNKITLTAPSRRRANITQWSNEEMEDAIQNGGLAFVVHGIIAPNAEQIEAFETLYGITFISENCSIDPLSFKSSTNHNRHIAAYLTFKYGNDWKDQLPATPFGVSLQ